MESSKKKEKTLSSKPALEYLDCGCVYDRDGNRVKYCDSFECLEWLQDLEEKNV